MSKEKEQENLQVGNKANMGAGRVSGMLESDRASNTQGTLKRLLGRIKPFRGPFIVAVILTLLASLTQIFAPRLVGQILNLITETLVGQQGLNWPELGRIGLVLVILYLVHFAASYFSNFLMVRVTQNLVRSLRMDMQKKLNRLKLSYFDQSSAGDLVSLLTNDLDNVANTLQTGLTTSISAVVLLVGVVIMMFTIKPLLAIITLLILPLSYYMVRIVVGKAKPIFKANANLTGRFNGLVEEAYNGEDVVNYYGLGDDLKEDLESLNEDLYDSEWKSNLASFVTRPAGDLILNANYVALSIVGGYYVITGSMTIGDFQAFIQYTQMLKSPFQQVLGIMNTIMSALASAERIFTYLDAPESQELGDAEMAVSQVQGDLAFDDVDFGYTDDLLFDGVDLQVESGQQLAIVGSTGAGKTTLVNLLMRFYEVDGGEIRLDGQPATSYAFDEWRKPFSMVLQDTWLFTGSIRDNIAYGAPLEEGQTLEDVPLEDIKEAARLARADTFIERLPDQYDTHLVEGATNISQGQRQLLTIARALIKGAPIIILDEATSSVDTRTELLIQQGMAELTSNRTSFIIAHRLSTIHDADRIIVMDQGSIVETGTHDELLDQDGIYAQLYRAGSAS